MKTNGVKPCFIFFHDHYNDQKCVNNTHYMANKMITSGYKGMSIKLMGILTSFIAIRILMGVIILASCFNGHYDYENVKVMRNI